MKKIEEILEDIAEDIMLLEVDDVKTLKKLNSKFKTAAKDFGSLKMKAAKDLCRTCASKLGDIAKQRAEDADGDLELIKKHISKLQRVIQCNDDSFILVSEKSLDKNVDGNNSNSSLEILNDQILKDFLNRQNPILEALETLGMNLEQSFNQDGYNELLRIVHTIKGEAGVLNINVLNEVCHVLESALQAKVSKFDYALILNFKDWLQEFFNNLKKNNSQTESNSIISLINAELNSKSIETQKGNTKDKLKDKTDGVEQSQDVEVIVDDALVSEFIAKQEATMELLEELALSLELEEDAEKFQELLRVIHTIKGEASVLVLNNVVLAAHTLENVLNALEKFDFSVVFSFKDWLKQFIQVYSDTRTHLGCESLLSKFSHYTVKGEKIVLPKEKIADISLTDVVVAEVEEELDLGEDVSFALDFVVESKEHIETAEEALLACGSGDINEENINLLFRAIHTIKGIAGFLQLKDIVAISHEFETLLDKIRKNQLSLSQDVMDVSLVSLDKLKKLIERVDIAAKNSTPVKSDPSTKELVVMLKQAQEGSKLKAGKSIPAVVREISDSDQVVVKKSVDTAVDSSIRVGTKKLDSLIDMVGELVIAGAMIHQEVKNSDNHLLSKNLEQIRKITRELQDVSMSLRMIPLKSTFLKMSRIVRDISRRNGKEVDFVVTGEEAELDKTVVDRIGDPLVHMVRNAIDHGIEASQEDRINSGKNGKGKIYLRAFHKGGGLFIEIEDDGKGMDKNVILNKAIERGLTSGNESLTDKDIFNFIFEPGFSTAKAVTDISGRGVGMDVVKRGIENLRGTVEIKSALGKGSIFSIRLPLTLAIIDGMVVGIGGERYVFPILSMVMSLKPVVKDISIVAGRGELLRFQNQMIPILRLSSILEIKSFKKSIDDCIIVILEEEGSQVAFVTDEIIGQQEVVIKSLGDMLHNVPGISGGAIMPDGAVGLILDVGGLIKIAHS